MARPTLQQQLANAELKANRLRAQLAENRRADDARRKIVIGGTMLAAMGDDEELRGKVLALLRERVTRPLDREVIADLLGETPAGIPANGHDQSAAPAEEMRAAE